MSDQKNTEGNNSSTTIRLIAEEVVTYAREDEEECADKIYSLLSRFDNDINESILKNVDDKFEFAFAFYSNGSSTYTFTAISDHPHFTILHLQVFIWMMFGFHDRWVPTDPIWNHILAVASCGGDIGLPMRGIKFEIDSMVPNRIVDGPTTPWDVYENYNRKTLFWVNEYSFTINKMKNRVREKNPFFQKSSQPGPTFVNGLLFIEDFSDVKVLCEKDGTAYPAHQIILSSSSPYFQQYFTGPWSTEGGGEYYKTEVDSDIMKYLLTFIYTNSFGTSLVGMPVDTLLKIRETGRFFQMDNLVDCCTRAIYGCKTDFLVSTISIETIKDTIITAHITRPCLSSSSQQQASDGGEEARAMESMCDDANTRLWTKCVEFLLSNSEDLMFDTNFMSYCMSLTDEYPEIWKELKDEVSKLKKQNMEETSS